MVVRRNVYRVHSRAASLRHRDLVAQSRVMARLLRAHHHKPVSTRANPVKCLLTSRGNQVEPFPAGGGEAEHRHHPSRLYPFEVEPIDGGDTAERSLVQHEDGLFARRETVTGGRHLHPLDDESALLEHPERCPIAGRHTSVQRTGCDFEQEQPQRSGGDPVPPVLPADPVPDVGPTVAPEAGDVPDQRLAQQDRLRRDTRVSQGVCPVRIERLGDSGVSSPPSGSTPGRVASGTSEAGRPARRSECERSR